MRFDVRKAAAALAAVAMLAVAGPVAVTTANAADAPAASETAAQHVFVTFHYGKGSYGIPNSFNTVPVAVDKGASLADAAAKAEAQYGQPVNEGNVFAGWSKDGVTALDGSTPINGDTDLYPVFFKAATVTFNGLDAAAGYVRQITLKSGSKFSEYVDALKKQVSLPTPPEGFELVFKKVVDGVKTDLKGDEVVTDGFEVSVEFAKKPVELVFVVFNTGADMAAPTQVAKGSTWAEVKGLAPSLPAPEGKAFAGWTVDGKEVLADSYVFDAPTTNLYPLYEDAKPAVEHVTVTFYEDESLSSVFVKVENVEKDKTTFAELAKKVGAPTREGKVFVGWYGIGGDVIDPNATFTFPRDTALIAAWKDAVTLYTVTFVGPDGKTIAAVSKPKGTLLSAFAQDVQVPAVNGKTFDGWKYANGNAAYDVTPVVTDLTVYASYRDNGPQFPFWGWPHWFQGWQNWFGSWQQQWNNWWR